MRTLIISLAGAFTLAIAGPLYAQDTVESSETKFFVLTSGASPEVCGVEFTLVYRDQTYRQGAAAGITGSLSWVESDGNIALLFKLLGSDVISTADRVIPTVFSVFQGSLTVDGKTIRPDETLVCEDATGFCAAYFNQNSVLIYEAVVSGKRLSIGFSRQIRGLDIALPLETRKSAATNPNELANYSTCFLALAQRALDNLKKAK